MIDERIDLIEEEQNEEFSNDDLFNITSWGADPSVRELILQYKEGDIEKPELQRKYVWILVAWTSRAKYISCQYRAVWKTPNNRWISKNPYSV